MGDRCTGHCCRSFPLPGWTPEQLAESLAGGDSQPGTDRHFWERNAIPLAGTYKVFWPPAPAGYERNPLVYAARHLYTCRQFDTDTGNCKDYENRPQTCSAYPYQYFCDRPGCTSTEFRSPCDGDLPRPNRRQRDLSIHGKTGRYFEDFRINNVIFRAPKPLVRPEAP